MHADVLLQLLANFFNSVKLAYVLRSDVGQVSPDCVAAYEAGC